ncbi:MAG TPA: GNAT family N-acetyltransferase [Clostridia bacterium]|nr:GNAT family N-acetyltransferase [Clostridia bacterium]
MKRKIYIKNSILSIAQYLSSDAKADYDSWQETETQKSYNYKIKSDFTEFSSKKRNHRFYAAITLNDENQTLIGFVMLSPPDSPPDLAIRIKRAFQNNGYGSSAFALATDYCINKLGYDKIYAGCFETNIISRKMLIKCGYKPNPEGNTIETNIYTGEKIIQYDYVFEKL